MGNARLDEAQAGIKIAGRNINNLRYADDHPYGKTKEEPKSLLMKWKEESEGVGLKLNIQKTNSMASGPITSWQIDRKTMKTVQFSSVAQSCLTLCDPVDCSLPGSSIYGIFQARVLEWGAIIFSNDKPRQCIKKQRHPFADKGPSSQSYGISSSHVWMWELDCKESWTPKIWCF